MRLIGHSCERQTSNLAGETSKSGQVLVRTVENKTEFIDHLSEGYVRSSEIWHFLGTAAVHIFT